MRALSLIGGLITGFLMTGLASAQMGPSKDAMNSDLRDLLQAASEDGWIEFVPNEKTVEYPGQSVLDDAAARVGDCPAFIGIDPNGLFSENPLKDRALNRLLPKLLEGMALTETQLGRFSGLAICGPEFATWEHLASSQVKGRAVSADTAIAALYSQNVHIRERAGLTLAIAAGLADDRASLRRFADMLEDAELHSTSATERDPRHIFLDALLLESRDPSGARQRYEWLSKNDGPEQILALDRLTVLGASKFASDSLDRLGQDLSLTDPSRLAELKMRAALETGRLSDVSTLLRSGSIVLADVTDETKVTLVNMTRTALSGDDVSKQIAALDLYSRFASFYVDQDLETAAELAFDTIIGTVSEAEYIEGKDRVADFGKESLHELKKVNSEDVSRFISDISKDLVDAERILSNG